MPSSGAGSFDAVVVGAGPAGCLAARQLASAGASVLVLERRDVPRWKVCGSCVGVGALSVLAEVGLGDLPRAGRALPLSELVVQSRRRRALLPLEGGASWSRAAMDEALLRAAERAGATCWTGAHARIGPLAGGHRLVTARLAGGTVALRARVVVDAAGLGGTPHPGDSRGVVRPDARVGVGAIVPASALVRVTPMDRAGGAAGRRACGAVGEPAQGAAPRAGAPVELPPGRIHMIVGRTGYVGMVRLEDGSLDVAAAVEVPALRRGPPGEAVGEILEEAGLRLAGEPTRGWRGTPPLTRAPTRAAESRLFRIGDAMGYVEPFTGEGIGWALASARAVTPLVLRGIDGWDDSIERGWQEYAVGQAERSRRLCRVVSRGLRHPFLVESVLALLARAPALAVPWIRRAGRVRLPQRDAGQEAA